MAEGDGGTVVLRLYVAGEGRRSSAARRATTLLAERLDGCQVEIVDVVVDPGKAEEGRVIATPTLVRMQPQPMLRVIGGLDDVDQIARLLQLDVREGEA